MSSPNAHKFTCEMDLARTYLRHGKLALAFECAETAWWAAYEMKDYQRAEQALALQGDISDRAAA